MPALQQRCATLDAVQHEVERARAEAAGRGAIEGVPAQHEEVWPFRSQLLGMQAGVRSRRRSAGVGGSRRVALEEECEDERRDNARARIERGADSHHLARVRVGREQVIRTLTYQRGEREHVAQRVGDRGGVRRPSAQAVRVRRGAG